MIHPDKELMERAIKLAKEKYEVGGSAVAAVIVKGGEIIAEAFTTIHRDQDPTNHAEMNAIRIAAKRLGSQYLHGCYLYTTYEPCPMCTSAAVFAKMEGIVYGASKDDRPEEGYSWKVGFSASEVVEKGTPKLKLFPEFLREECKQLLLLKPIKSLK